METLVAILDFLFGCHHSHLSRVFTLGGRTYQVCCDCGAKFIYSLASMCIERRLVESSMEPSCGFEGPIRLYLSDSTSRRFL